MILFNNAILEELSTQGRQYLGSHLQTYLSSLPKHERSNTAVGIKLTVANPNIFSNSLSDLHKEDTTKRRLNCSLYFCVTLHNEVALEYEILPQHLKVESFQYLERTLQQYNMYWKGSSMYVYDK